MTTPTEVPADNLPAVLGNSKTKLPDVLSALVKPRPPERHQVVDIPKTVTITPKVAAAVEALALDVARTTPALTVTERRMLTQAEIDMLSDERNALDAIEKYIAARRDAHRAMVFNHFDVKAEESGVTSLLDVADQDDKGHWLIADEEPTSDGENKFVRQLSEGRVTLTAEALLAEVDKHGDLWTRADYLACTVMPEVPRVLDEARALKHLRSRPEVAPIWAAAIKVGKKTASFYHR